MDPIILEKQKNLKELKNNADRLIDEANNFIDDILKNMKVKFFYDTQTLNETITILKQKERLEEVKNNLKKIIIDKAKTIVLPFEDYSHLLFTADWHKRLTEEVKKKEFDFNKILEIR